MPGMLDIHKIARMHFGALYPVLQRSAGSYYYSLVSAAAAAAAAAAGRPVYLMSPIGLSQLLCSQRLPPLLCGCSLSNGSIVSCLHPASTSSHTLLELRNACSS